MRADEMNFLRFIQDDAQFVIPIFQRNYSWERKQCQQLFDDIIRLAESGSQPAHFVGSIVFVESSLYQHATVPQLLVIDGQQRLTTISLMLIALRDRLRELEMSANAELDGLHSANLEDYYIINSKEKGILRRKLVLNRTDDETLRALADGQDPPIGASRRIIDNYMYLRRLISDSKYSPNEILGGLRKLLIVAISLDRTNDNPQLIFESLNSTGLALSQADLIRNFILMDLEPDLQARMYTEHWEPMEQRFGQEGYTSHFNRFMRDYLTVKTGSIPNEQAVYEAFKEFRHSSAMDLEQLLEEIGRYARYFANLALEQEQNPGVRAAIRDLNELKVAVAYPFLLEAYKDFDMHLIADGDMIEILRLVESYVIRRTVCSIPTNSLNKTFLTFAKGIKRDRYVLSVEASFQLLEGNQRFPADDEFSQKFVVYDLYNSRRRNYILQKLANSGRKEVLNVGECTIEHILPQTQNLSDEWISALGGEWERIRDQYLHTPGNLTLTMYNSEMSDRPFLEKRDMEGGFSQSAINLNRDLAELPDWNEKELLNRGSRLADLAVGIWKAPRLGKEELALLRHEAPVDGRVPNNADIEKLLDELLAQISKRAMNLDADVEETRFADHREYSLLEVFASVYVVGSSLKIYVRFAPEEASGVPPCNTEEGDRLLGDSTRMFELSDVSQVDCASSLISKAYELEIEYEDSATRP